MADTITNEILAEEASQAYRARAVTAKFKQQVTYGLGGALVFGVAAGVVGALLHPLTAVGATLFSAAALPAVLGVAAVMAIGVVCLYLNAKYIAENTIADQELQAKQICAATHGKAPCVEQAIAPIVSEPVQTFPDTAAPKIDAPSTIIGSERELADTVIARSTQPSRAA